MRRFDAVIAGAGAAGMLAAGHAGELGHSVDIFEKNNKPYEKNNLHIVNL